MACGCRAAFVVYVAVVVVATAVLVGLVDGQDSYKLYLTKVYIKNACTKEGHSNMNHCLKCIMKSFKGAKELQQEISVCLAGPPKTIQECFKNRTQGKEIEGCLIDKQQRINCYGIGIRKIHDVIYEEVKIKNGIIKCQAQDVEDFVDCMNTNSFAPRVFTETFFRCQLGKVTRTCLHKEYPGFEVDDFLYAMKNCPGHQGLLTCLQDNLKDYPKCFPKQEETSTVPAATSPEN